MIFFQELDKDESVVKSPTGLRYTIIAEGSETRPNATDAVMVEYTGTRINGEVFDSSEKRGEPLTIPLNRVVKGWTEGLQLIGEGGEIRLYIPPDLGYGKKVRPGGRLLSAADTAGSGLATLDRSGSLGVEIRPEGGRIGLCGLDGLPETDPIPGLDGDDARGGYDCPETARSFC